MSMYITLTGPTEVRKPTDGEKVAVPDGKWVVVYRNQEIGEVAAITHKDGTPKFYDSEEEAGRELMEALKADDT